MQANLAALFHWQPSEMAALELVDFIQFHDQALMRTPLNV